MLSWLNTSSGEVFVCIDATANGNTWVGQLGSLVEFVDASSVDASSVIANLDRGIFGGGYDGSNTNTIELCNNQYHRQMST